MQSSSIQENFVFSTPNQLSMAMFSNSSTPSTVPDTFYHTPNRHPLSKPQMHLPQFPAYAPSTTPYTKEMIYTGHSNDYKTFIPPYYTPSTPAVQTRPSAASLNRYHYDAADDAIVPSRNKKRVLEDQDSPDFQPELFSLQQPKRSKFEEDMASKEEPRLAAEEDVEKILMRLRHSNEWYRPLNQTLSHILSTPNLPNHASFPGPPAKKRKFFDERSESRLSTSGEEILAFSPSSPSLSTSPTSPISIVIKKRSTPKLSNSGGSEEQQQYKEYITEGLCCKTNKPKVQREYYYSKLSKTIFRWTCCGSQARTHPDA